MRDNTNHGVAHEFAQQNSESGKTNNGNMYYEGRVIYSYGSHYPIAIFLNNGEIAFNDTSSSATTEGKHKVAVRRALNYQNMVYLSSDIMDMVNRFHDWDSEFSKKYFLLKDSKDRLIDRVFRDAKYYCNQAIKRRKESLRDSDYASAIAELNQVVYFFKYIGVHCPKKVLNFIDDIQNNRDALTEKFEAEKARDAKKTAKLERERIKAEKIRIVEQTEKFRAGEWFNYFSVDNSYLLRLKPIDDLRAYDPEESHSIETSGKACFPIEDGKKAWLMIKACKDRKTEFKRNGKSIRLGSFQIDSISQDGDIIAGCHKVQFSEVERIAQELNLI